MAEGMGARWRRRWLHLSRHPIAWARYVWRRELRHQEVSFRVNPRFLDWAPGYLASRPGLVRITGRPSAELDGYFGELLPLHAELLDSVGDLPSAGALMQAPELYVLVRALRPAVVVETGVSSGYSARLILEALERNGSGRLTSIGIDVFGHRGDPTEGAAGLAGRHVGWLVPERLSYRWTLALGTSEERLPELLRSGAEPIDLFLHDSLHQYATMRWEFATAYPGIPPGGVIASHDIHANRAWPEFLAQQGLTGDEQLDHDLGAVRRPRAA